MLRHSFYTGKQRRPFPLRDSNLTGSSPKQGAAALYPGRAARGARRPEGLLEERCGVSASCPNAKTLTPPK